MGIATVNPTTGETEEEFRPHDDGEVERRVEVSRQVFGDWRATSFGERARLLQGTADLLEGEFPDVARMVTTEMGKPYAQAKGEVAKCARAMRWFAEHAEALLADEPAETDTGTGRVIYRPMGAVLAVMPWNFPLWQVTRFLAPHLMAGNVGLLKHASNVPQTACYLEDVLRRAGLPEGVFQTLLVGSGRVGALIADPRVAAVTLTGSEGAGRSVGAAAGRALKKVVLELGGSDPFVVLADADVDRAVAVGVEARVQNNGQSCIAAKRFIVVDAIADTFIERFVAAMERLSVGDPMDLGTEVGPLATAQVRDDVAGQVDDARDRGATILCGGTPPDRPGFFYPPTVITDIDAGMRVHDEEVFGPVALLTRVPDEAAALAAANDTRFGLGASLWTADPATADRFADKLDAGMVFVNAMVSSAPSLPFGGMKDSGFGRELSGLGIREFCVARTVVTTGLRYASTST